MKILIFNWQDISNPLAGGAEVHLHEIFKRIVKFGNEVTLFCSMYKGAKEIEEIDGIKIIREGSRELFNYKVKGKYLRVFEKMNFDIVIDDINKIPFFTPRFVREPILGISHHFFGKSIYREAGLLRGSYVFLAEKLVDLVYKNTQFAVVSESTLQEFIHRGFDRSNFSIIPNAITHSDFPMSVQPKSQNYMISYFGRMKKYKSIDHLVKAFSLLTNEFQNLELHLIGKGDYLPELEKLSKQLNIYDNLHIHGYVDNQRKIELLTKSHIVVNTSMKEGWGITNIESNACGTPVISANVPGLKDSVDNGVSGLLYEYGDINQLAQLLRTVLRNNELRNSLSEGAVVWANNFSWDNSALLMQNRMQDVISNSVDHKR